MYASSCKNFWDSPKYHINMEKGMNKNFVTRINIVPISIHRTAVIQK